MNVYYPIISLFLLGRNLKFIYIIFMKNYFIYFISFIVPFSAIKCFPFFSTSFHFVPFSALFCDSHATVLFLIFFSSLALEEETDSLSQDTAETLPEEERLGESSERDALLGSSGTPEVEDSFL